MWTAKLEDLLSRLNDLKLLCYRTNAFKKKLAFWKINVHKGDIDMFLCLQGIVANASVNTEELFTQISQHLQKLSISFGQYFSDNADTGKGNFWIGNSFTEILIRAV